MLPPPPCGASAWRVVFHHTISNVPERRMSLEELPTNTSIAPGSTILTMDRSWNAEGARREIEDDWPPTRPHPS